MATLLVGCVLSAAAGFLVGWWKGRQDFSSDLDSDLEGLHQAVLKIRTSCESCGADYVAGCPNRCGKREEG